MILLLRLQQYSGILVIEVICMPSLKSLEFDRIMSGAYSWKYSRGTSSFQFHPNPSPRTALGGNLIKKKTFISFEKLKVMWKNLKQNCIRITPFFSYLWITFCCFTSIFYFVLTSFIYLRYFSGTRVRTGAGQVAKIMKSTQKVLIRHLIAGFTLFQNSSILFHFI